MRTTGIRGVLKKLVPPELVRYRFPDSQGMIALTFDDGPCPGTTDKIVDLLANRGHQATFFMLGDRAEKYPQLVTKVLASGNEVGSHGYSHKDLTLLSREEIEEEIGKAERILSGITSTHSFLFRPQKGRLSPRVLYDLRRCGQKRAPVLWSVCVPREHQKSENEILNVLKTANLCSGDIVLLHDDNPNLPKVLSSLLDILQAKGLWSRTISHLFKTPPRI